MAAQIPFERRAPLWVRVGPTPHSRDLEHPHAAVIRRRDLIRVYLQLTNLILGDRRASTLDLAFSDSVPMTVGKRGEREGRLGIMSGRVVKVTSEKVLRPKIGKFKIPL